MIDFQPDEDQQLIVDTVRQFAQNELRPAAREAEESRKLPAGLLAAAHELGLVGHGLPEAHGGGGAPSCVTGALIAEELGWGDLGLALAILSPSLIGVPVATQGTPAQQAALLPALLGPGFVPGSLALVEEQFGADPYRPITTARREGDRWRLEGAKCLVPWLEGGTHVLVSASSDARAELFVVPRDAAGLEAKPVEYMGARALPWVDLDLAGVSVPGDARLGGDAGSDVAAIVDRGRAALAALAVGVARAAFEVARDYAKQREAFGVPIATKQAIAFMLADMAIEIDGARLLAWEAAWTLDQGGKATRECALAIQQARKVALRVADGAVQVFGGHGYIREYLPELALRNARGFAVLEATTLI